MLLRSLIVLVVLGLAVGLITPTEVGEGLRLAFDWTVDTVVAVADNATR